MLTRFRSNRFATANTRLFAATGEKRRPAKQGVFRKWIVPGAVGWEFYNPICAVVNWALPGL